MKGSLWDSPQLMVFFAIMRTNGIDLPAFERRASLHVRQVDRTLTNRYADTLTNIYTGPIIEARGPGTPDKELLISGRLQGVAVIVLLIACANVINLLLARAMTRRREIAVRLTLGISRSRLVRLLTTETIALALLAAAGALVAAAWASNALRALLVPDVQWVEAALHWRVMVFTVVVALLCGLIAGLVPALQFSNPQLTGALKDAARDETAHRSRLRDALLVTQAALSVMLLTGAALFVRSLHNVQGLDIGFDAPRLVFGHVNFEPGQELPRAIVGAKMREVEQLMQSRPGVERVTRAGLEPMRGFSFLEFYWGSDSSESLRPNFPTYYAVSPGFFATTGVRVLRGSVFGEAAPGEMVVNEAMARAMWPTTDPIGQCVYFMKRDAPCHRVVGIVETVRRDKVIEQPARMFYLPLGTAQTKEHSGSTVIVRASPKAKAIVERELRTAIQRAFPGAEPVIRTMTENLESEYRPWRLGATLFTGFGFLALIVAIVGIYSSVSYSVNQRTHEFGVRVALGARLMDVLQLVVGEGLRVVAIGVLLGLALALAAGRLIAALLYGIAPSDPGVMVFVSAALLIVAVFATLLPAWRAARVDPVTALRAE
jgi:predicted permease